MTGLNLLETPPYLIPILRGVTSDRVIRCADILFEAGMPCVEVPLNSPSPFESIEKLREHFGEKCDIGAGTVTSVEKVFEVKQAGANLVLTPNCNPQVIEACFACGLKCIPGFTTVTEAFQAIEAGARQLKLFPASQFGPAYMKSIRAVLPEHVQILPVGGINADNIGHWLQSGAAGAGIGNWLFTPETKDYELRERAKLFVERAMPVTNNLAPLGDQL